jgi:uncharacterized protein (DUF983 family)
MIFPIALMDSELLKLGWACKCPACKTGNLYKSKTSLELQDHCPSCGLDLKNNDSADGPAVFLIFILGALLVPIALMTDAAFHWPLWLHACVWGALALTMTLGALRPLKAYIIALQFKHRRTDWDK